MHVRQPAAAPVEVPTPVARRVVELACRAPSVYNTQPWAWRLRSDGLELYADHQRRLPVADPEGRELHLSCGAALHHAVVVARASGWAAQVHRFPDPGRPALVAQMVLERAPLPRSAAGDLNALRDRRTDRRRFTSWPVPDERLQELANVAQAHGAGAVSITEVTERFHVELLVSRALQLQARDPRVLEEQRAWLRRRHSEGVSLTTVPESVAGETSYRSRFGQGSLEDSGREVLGSDGLIVLHADADDRESWLRGGEGLSALWLEAVRLGLSVVPLSQVVEVQETRAALRHDLLGGQAHPLLLVRVGWQAISRSHLDPSPRRALAQVLLP